MFRADGAGPGLRARSLQREWSGAFVLMLASLLTVAAGAVLGVHAVVEAVQGTGRQLTRESATVTALRTAVVDHEEVGHQLLSDKPVDRVAYLRAQDAITRQFQDAVTIFPVVGGMRTTMVQARSAWQRGLSTYGLWGAQVQSLRGDHSADNPKYGAASDDVVAQLSSLEGPALAAMSDGLDRGEVLERTLIAALVAAFGLAAGVIVYFRRRMAHDILHPVAVLHRGVLRIQAGEYEHHVDVARRDELGELAEAFNVMASALSQSHHALTVRATRDTLTGLANRATLNERLGAVFAPGGDRRAAQESLLFIDIDDFKNVNDTLGHEGGDLLLVQLAARLTDCVRPQDLVTRLGGDEFAVIVYDDAAATAGVEVAERILDALQAPFDVNGTRLQVAVSIGVARRRPDTSDPAELLRQADFAMYMAKGGGKNRYQLFDPQQHDDMVGNTTLKADLALALAGEQLFLEYQPIADLHTGRILGVEALVRWQHPTRGLIPPTDFIPVAEDTGDIEAIGCWVLETAARQAATWRQSHDREDLWVSVNLSAFQLPSPHSLAAIEGILADPATHADKVVLEVTETALALDKDGGVTSLKLLKASGARIALDDFGTGYSSLSTLTQLPVDIIKIDRSFISGPHPSSTTRPMLEGILGLADKLNLPVIAEGIETPEQLQMLRNLGYSTGQGYHLTRPQPATAITELLTTGTLTLDPATPTAS